MIQYLTLLFRYVPEFEKQKRYEEIDTLFTYLEPVVGEDWRFSALRYEFCHKTEEKCRQYLEKLKQYAAEHPDDPKVQGVIQEFEKK